MKYLLVIVVLVVAWAVWRSGRRSRTETTDAPAATPPPSPGPASAAPVRMLACLHCGTHVPESEAVQGERGAYCGRPHLLASEPAGSAGSAPRQ